MPHASWRQQTPASPAACVEFGNTITGLKVNSAHSPEQAGLPTKVDAGITWQPGHWSFDTRCKPQSEDCGRTD